ncbi:MAG: U5 small nuclear ribonucleoprotein, partial [Paramarteilia canceri]
DYGHLFERESIYSYLYAQKQHYKKSLQLYHANKAKIKVKNIQKSKEKSLLDFEAKTDILKLNKADRPTIDSEQQHGLLATSSFWLKHFDNKTENKFEKPKKEVLCPIENKKLTLSMLHDAKFMKKKLRNQEEYVCPITGDTLTDATTLLYLKSS